MPHLNTIKKLETEETEEQTKWPMCFCVRNAKGTHEVNLIERLVHMTPV